MKNLKALLTWGLLLAATHVMGYTITVNPIEIEAGQSTNLIINLNNTETNLTAYQMKIFLPTGVTVQKKANGKYAYTSNADRLDPDLFTVTVKDAVDGSVLIAVFSPDKDVIAGTSGELIRLPIDVASTVTTSLQGSLKEIEFTDVNNQAYNISDVNFTMTMPGSGTPDPGVVTGDVTVSVPDVAITAGSSTNLIINMQTGLTNLTAYQMKLYLPTGVTVQKKANGKYAYTSNADRLDPDLFTITVKDAADGSVLIAVFSPDKDVIAGTSGELIRLPIDVASTVTTSLQGSLKEIEFTDVNNQAYNISDVNFTMTMGGETSPNITFADPAVKALCVANWDTNHDGELSEAEAAAVTDLGEVFKSNTTITSFNELQYFTGLTSIGEYAFSGCSGLTSVTIPNSVTSIGDRAFFNCIGLTSVTIRSGVTSIGNYAFSYCSSLTSIVVESGNTIYDSRNNCNAIIETSTNTLIAGCMNTVIPESVTSIGDATFFGCSSLTSITIPNSVTSIGNHAFRGCHGLTSVTIPNSVTSIGNFAFMYCDSLTSITIPNSVTTIGGCAFMYCDSLTSITIPNSVTTIGSRAFYDCSSLTDVWCYAEDIPGSGTDLFLSTDIASATLHVPAASLEEYSTTAPWSGFGTIVAIGDDVEKEEQTLSLASLPEMTEGDAAYSLPEQTEEGLALTWSIEDATIASINGYQLTPLKAGTTTVTATQAGNSNYLPFTKTFTLTVNESQTPPSIEVTDISQLDNVIYIEPTEARCGEEKVLSIKMKNNVPIQTIKFDLYLPEGVSVVRKNNKLITPSTERIDEYDTFKITSLSNGSIRLLALAAIENEDGTITNISAGDGEICQITIKPSDDMEEGDYPIIFKETQLVERNNTLHSPEPNIVQTKLTVFSYILGDANSDGNVDAIDFNMIANKVLGYDQSNFNIRAADINGDGEVDAIDFNMIANKILYDSFSGKQ